MKGTSWKKCICELAQFDQLDFALVSLLFFFFFVFALE